MTTKIAGPLYDAEDKAMRISYAYSKNPQSAAELVQGMIDGAVQERCALLLEALTGIIDIGKRDLANPKYDGYFESAIAAIRSAKGEL